MAHVDREELLREGERLLGEWGVAADAAPSALAALIGRADAADAAIANRAGAQASEASVALLQQLEQRSGDKRVLKEVKRAFYRLEQRGIHAPPAPAPVAPVLTVPIEGYVSAIDGAGDQLVWIVKPRPGGLAHLFAVINDPAGLREVELNVITRKALKGLCAELLAKHEIRLVPTDWHYCDFLMHRAFRWARDRQTPMTGDYPALRAQLLKEAAAENLPPLVLTRLDPAEIAASPNLLADSAQLLEEPELRTWSFEPEALRPYLDELLNLSGSLLVLNEAQQEERARAVAERAVAELFAGEQRDSYVRRLHELAHFFAVTHRLPRAKQAVAVAQALAASPRGGHDIPFCEALARASLGAVFNATMAQETKRAESSLVVTPQQFMAERQRR